MRFLIFVLLLLACGCVRPAPVVPAALPIRSPNGKLTLTASINDAKDAANFLCVVIDVTDANDAVVGQVQTSASDRMKWAVGWFDDSTIVLDSSDIGSRAWKVNEDQSISEIETLSPELTEFGKAQMAEKYP